MPREQGSLEEFMESFEEIQRLTGMTDEELTDDEEITLYTIGTMFRKDKAFRIFMQICLRFYAKFHVHREVLSSVAIVMVEAMSAAEEGGPENEAK